MNIPPRAGQAPPWLSLAFFVAAFLALLAAQAVLIAEGETLLRHYLLPRSVALAHLAVLGWVTMAIIGATYQLVSVLVQARLWSVKLAVVQGVLFFAGWLGLVESFWVGQFDSLPVHGATAFAGIALFLLVAGMTFRRITEWNASARYMAAALGALALTVSAGFLYTFALDYGWFPVTTRRIALHAHLGIAGWMGLMLMGVSYRLLPMFLLVRGHSERLARANLWLLISALLALVTALALDAPRPLIVAPALALAAGFAVWLIDAARMFRLRLRRRLDLYAWHLFLGAGALVLTIVAGLGMATGLLTSLTGEPRAAAAYAYLALGGWLTLMVMGHSYKIVPMLTWQLRHAPQGAAGGRTVLLHEMYGRRLAAAALALYAAGAAITTSALLAGSLPLLQTGVWLGMAGVLGYLANMVWVMAGRHAAKPGGPPRRAGQRQNPNPQVTPAPRSGVR